MSITSWTKTFWQVSINWRSISITRIKAHRIRGPSLTFCLCLHAEWSQSDLVRGSGLHYSQQWTLIADNNNHKTVRSVLPAGPCTSISGESVLLQKRSVKLCHDPTEPHVMQKFQYCFGRAFSNVLLHLIRNKTNLQVTYQ